MAQDAVIYPAQSVMTLISRAWNLCKLNFKNSVLMVLPPIVLLTLVNIVASAMSSDTFLTRASWAALGYKLALVVAAVLLMVPFFFCWVYSCCALSRYYFSAIVGNTPLSLKDCWGYVGKNWLVYTLMAVVLGVTSLILMVINMALLIAGVFLSSMLIVVISAAMPHLHNSVFPVVMVIMFLILWGFSILTAVLCMGTLQGFAVIFPMLAVSTSPKTPERWWPVIRNSYRLMFSNFPRLLVFALALFAMSFVMGLVMTGPAMVWMAFEWMRLGVTSQYHVPMHIKMVMNIWSSLVNLILYPFQISAVTMLWYDCLVRKEGLDLRLWFNQVVSRHGHSPEEYQTEVEPQPV